MAADMRDWPMTLRRNAAVCELAKAMYRARGEVFGGSTELSDQPPSVRQTYIQHADDIVRGLRPSVVVTLIPRDTAERHV